MYFYAKLLTFCNFIVQCESNFDIFDYVCTITLASQWND